MLLSWLYKFSRSFIPLRNGQAHLIEFKAELEMQRKEELYVRFDEEKREVEIAHIEEISSFNKFWDEKLMEHQNEAERRRTRRKSATRRKR